MHHLDAVSTITYGCIISLETALPLPLSEGSDRGEWIGFQTAGPDCGPHRGVRTTTETRTGPSAQRDRARGCHPAPVPAGRPAVAQPARHSRAGQRLDFAAVPGLLGRARGA